MPGRKPRTVEVKPEPDPPATPATVPLPDADPLSLVPAPPDAPQNKGQLLDFIEALKKSRPNILTPRKKSGGAAKKRAAAPEPAARLPADSLFGLGYGPAPDAPQRRQRQSPQKPAPAIFAKAKLPVPVLHAAHRRHRAACAPGASPRGNGARWRSSC